MMDVRWRIYGAAGKWEMAVEVAGVVMKMLPARKATIMYALAAVACRLKWVEEARRWLGEAMTLGGKEMKLRALDDPGLKWVG